MYTYDIEVMLDITNYIKWSILSLSLAFSLSFYVYLYTYKNVLMCWGVNQHP